MISKTSLFCSALLLAIGFFAVIAHTINTESVVDKAEINIDPKTGDRLFKQKPFSGTAITRYSDGSIAKKEQFINGRRHGYVKHWFENGALGFEAHYVAGRREGLTTSWWSNGSKRSVNLYKDDKISGTAWRWYKTGEKFKQFNYIAGQPSGLQQAWRRNGKLFANFEYKNGRVYGLQKSNLCFGLEDEKIVLNEYD